jgi:hypothetical protein
MGEVDFDVLVKPTDETFPADMPVEEFLFISPVIKPFTVSDAAYKNTNPTRSFWLLIR